MINNLESYNKARLIELVKTQIEEYQKLEKNLGLIKLGIEQQHKQLISCETALDERNNKVSLQASRIAELEKDNADLQECFDTCYAELEATRVAHDELEKERDELNEKFEEYFDAFMNCKCIPRDMEAHNLEQQISAVKQLINNVGVCQGDKSVGCYLDYDMVIDELNELEQAKQLREGVK